MSWFKKGDIVRVNGKPAIVDSDVYKKTFYDDCEVAGRPQGTIEIFCVNVIFPETGVKWTVKATEVVAIGREFP